MSGSIWGKCFRISTFGESHGRGIGVVVDGCPAGVYIDTKALQHEMQRRKPGQSAIVTQRHEEDEVEILSGIFEGKTTGTPIGMVIYNQDQKSKDYSHIAESYRPSHADYTFDAKFGHRDYRGGGRSSARETAARVAAGAIAKQFLAEYNICCYAYVSQVGDIILDKNYKDLDLNTIDDNIVRCPDTAVAEQMIDLIKAVKKDGDTIGGVITGVITGVPAGLGEPVFDKLHADLSKAMMSINAAKGFDYGSGFGGVNLRGSQHNDRFVSTQGHIETETNLSGGIQGGISNGMDIYFRVAFKPVATIMHDQLSVDKYGNEVTVSGKGRHDPCVLPRAVPIVEAMSSLVITDHLLRQRLSKK